MAAASEFSFPSPYDKRSYHKRKTAIELRIMTASQRIRENNGWRVDMKRDEMIDHWRNETISQGLRTGEFDCVLEQLKYYDERSTALVEVAAVDGTWQADNLVCDQLKNEFLDAVNDLLDKPYKDYELVNDNLVRNIIDPALYCLVYDVTRVMLDAVPCLRYIGGGKKLDAPIIQKKSRCSSPIKTLDCYQLLPAEFHIRATGQVEINSYINNVHPINDRHLYPVMGKIFECFIPLFNGVLNDLLKDNEVATHPEKKRKLEQPNPACSTTFDLRGRDVQVIVKLKSIELTPEKHEFNAGDWHTEGSESEHIVATGLYCFHSENITQSRLNFRQNQEFNQESGSIVTCEDRMCAFPNVYQHRIDSFELVDKTKPGYRKILVFFLVDPTKQITSTRYVPPQQMSWFNEELQNIPPFDRMDWYVVEYITSFLSWPMSRKMAEEYRLRLKEKRRETEIDKNIQVFRTD